MGELELTALLIHAYAHMAEAHLLCPCGASMGDGYGPIVVARRPLTREETGRAVIAVPGTLTSAFLSLSLWLGQPFEHIVVPFDRVLDVVEAGEFEGRKIDAGLVIHEGQLTYHEQGLALCVDLGAWWQDRHGLPLPLGGNGIRRDLGPDVIRDVNGLLSASINWGLDRRQESLEYDGKWGRNLDAARTDRFVGMYVNDWTRDFGAPGRASMKITLDEAFDAGLIPKKSRLSSRRNERTPYPVGSPKREPRVCGNAERQMRRIPVGLHLGLPERRASGGTLSRFT